MAKNILIYSDGTGQAGGLIPDEKRSNVYKLFRATRNGPDSDISPDKQIAFYDPGLGSSASGTHIKFKFWRKIYNLVSQATGFGITQNIIDCYAFILQVWEPGDRIYLFGFSRGAYTARCVGGVLAYCGVPVVENGKPIKRDPATAWRIAREAVSGVYQHGVGRTAERFRRQRIELAQRFRMRYHCDDNGQSNAVPYFVGVWDTVAALGAGKGKQILLGLVAAALLSIALSAVWVLGWVPDYFTTQWSWISTVLVAIGLLTVGFFSLVRLRFTTKTSDPWIRTMHFRAWRMKFYDTLLNPRVAYAKHALSIDENRKDFSRVPWTDKSLADKNKESNWFEQIWFTGVHSDVGGSYPETEARLSDVSLDWMVDRVTNIKHPVLINGQFLHLHPTPSGMQHDERKSSSIPWSPGNRTIPNDAPLHASVIARFESESVLHYDEIKPYRPQPLRNHNDVKHFYEK